MQILRTPDSRFDGLEGYPFAPRYVTVEAAGAPPLRMHYVDEGEGPTVFLLHGEPTWSYLYRSMIPVLVERGLRVVAPDLIGFGKSDKPTRVEDYTYRRHVAWLAAFLEALDLHDLTLVCQDWGSLLGLRLAAEHEGRFARLVVANGYLPEGREKLPPVFRAWQAFARFSPVFPIGWIVRAGCARGLSKAARRAYDAPFPNRRYKAGARAFPLLVPTEAGGPATQANHAAWQVLERWEKPVATHFGTKDPIFGGLDRVLQRRIPGTAGQPNDRIAGAGHFIQEDAGPELAHRVADFIATT